jgi:hypothetical protein
MSGQAKKRPSLATVLLLVTVGAVALDCNVENPSEFVDLSDSVVKQPPAADPLPADAELRKILAEMTAPEEPAASPPIWPSSLLFAPRAALESREDSAGSLWKRFRSAHPFGFQGIAISKIRRDGSCSVVVTEPPPHVSLEQLKELIPDATVMRQPNGHDGALFDVAGTLRGGEPEVLRKLRVLNHLLFHTEYGAFVYQEPFERPWQDAKGYDLDLRISAAELDSWIHDKAARFVSVEGSGPLTHADLVDSTYSGVYRLRDGNVVAWWVPATVGISDCLPEIRAFAIESDLVIGAIKERQGILILGRERLAPYELMPPLRAETIALLASSYLKEELQQSYQRNHPGAGPYTKEWDWAPILLSPELVNSEYGDLLNVSDQLLKGWSEHGDVTYENFNYPLPNHWVFPKALSAILRERFHQSTLTFNWNTTGTGYVVPFDSREVYALFRTGALPVSYMPGEDASLAPQVVSYEEDAYGWYAGLNNPTLVRVVQYAALYQLFHNFRKDTRTQHAPEVNGLAEGFAATMATFWKAAMSADVALLIKNSVMRARFEEAATEQPTNAGSETAPSEKPAAMMRSLMPIYLDILIRNGQQTWWELDGDDRRDIEQEGSTLDMRRLSESSFATLKQSQHFLTEVAASLQLADQYAKNFEASGLSWIHTPTVVMSRAKEVGAIGGHNVRAQATRLIQSAEVPLGRVRVESNLLRLNPMDIDRAPSIVRMAARSIRAGEKSALLEVRLAKALAEAPALVRRVPQEALRIPNLRSSLASARVKPFLPVETRTLKPPISVAELSRTHTGNRVTLVKHKNLYWVSGPDELPAVATSNLADASELTSLRMRTSNVRRSLWTKPKGAELDIYNFSSADREMLVKEVQFNARRKNFSQDILSVTNGERKGVSRLRAQDYNFKEMRVQVEKVVEIKGERFAKVMVEIPPARAGIRGAIVRFLVRFKTALSEGQMGRIMEAIEMRIKTVFGRTAAGELQGFDAVLTVHKEVRRLGETYGVEIETYVQEAADDWHLAAVTPHLDPQRNAAPGDGRAQAV